MGAMEMRSVLLGKRCLEMERFDYKACEVDQGAITLVLDLAKAFLGCGDARQFSQMRGGPITAILSGSTWSCLPLRIVLQDALSKVVKVVSASEVEGFCGGHHSFHGGAVQRACRYCREGFDVYTRNCRGELF